MRVLVVNYSETTSPGGINRVVLEVSKHLSRKGHEVIVLQPNPSNLPEEATYSGFKIIRIKSRIAKYFYGLSPGAYLYLKRHFKELDPDIVHVHGYHTLFSPTVTLAIRRVSPNVPIVFTPHYDPLNHSTYAGKKIGQFYDRLFGKKFLRWVNHIISISHFEANNLREALGVPGHKITVIPLGVNYIDKKRKKGESKKSKERIKLLYVGYLLEYKGVHHIVRALHELTNSLGVKNIVLRIVGNGKYKKKIIALSRKLGVYELIEWVPFVPHEEVLQEMRDADVLLLLSKSEGYGIVVAEALAVGTPCIVTMGTALEEFTKIPGCFGVIYPPNPKEVARLILKIVNSNVKIGPFGRKIRTWDKVAEDYERVYSELLNKK